MNPENRNILGYKNIRTKPEVKKHTRMRLMSIDVQSGPGNRTAT